MRNGEINEKNEAIPFAYEKKQLPLHQQQEKQAMQHFGFTYSTYYYFYFSTK